MVTNARSQGNDIETERAAQHARCSSRAGNCRSGGTFCGNACATRPFSTAGQGPPHAGTRRDRGVRVTRLPAPQRRQTQMLIGAPSRSLHAPAWIQYNTVALTVSAFLHADWVGHLHLYLGQAKLRCIACARRHTPARGVCCIAGLGSCKSFKPFEVLRCN